MQDDLAKRIEELRESVRAREEMIDTRKLSGELVSEVQLRILARHRGDLALLEELQRARPIVRARAEDLRTAAAGWTLAGDLLDGQGRTEEARQAWQVVGLVEQMAAQQEPEGDL